MLRGIQSRKYTNSSMRLLIMFLIIFTFEETWADWLWTPRQTTNLMASPRADSPVLRSVDPGEMVLITKLLKVTGGEWVSFTLVDGGEKTKVYVTKQALGDGELRNAKQGVGVDSKNFRNVGIGGVLSQTLRGPISKDASGGETVEYGPQYGVSFYPTLHYEFPDGKKNYRLFVSYRLTRAAGKSVIKQNGTTTSEEIMTQATSFVSAGFIMRERSTPQANFYWGYGAEVAKALSSKQEYTDGTTVDLKDSLPTNIYLLAVLGYQKFGGKPSHWLPEAKAGIVVNNKPVTLSGELILNYIWSF